MVTYTQAQRPMAVTTPLGADVMLLAAFAGHETVSRPFHYQLDLLVPHTRPGDRPVLRKVAMDDLLGQGVTVQMELPRGKRYFNGLCSRIAQGDVDNNFASYRMELVPQLWLLTRRSQSRIFQPPESSVPQILKKVLQGLNVEYALQGTFQPRDYCVQYRETDFNFASRLMEEEGIYYFFKHEQGKHTMVVANTPQGHPTLPGSAEILFEQMEGGLRPDDRVHSWCKVQELRSGKYTLWDYCFEKPDSHLDAQAQIQDAVQVGTVNHKLKVGGNDRLEVYDYPGEYAQRFDGIDKGGGEKPAEVQKIFEDNVRTVGLRMQEEAAAGLVLEGTGSCRQMVAGEQAKGPGGAAAFPGRERFPISDAVRGRWPPSRLWRRARRTSPGPERVP